MLTISLIVQKLLHIDQSLMTLISEYGVWTYAILFLIIFMETGLVITPFLPGDSLLFTAGSIAGNNPDTLDISLLFVLISLAAIIGNKINYLVGRFLGNHLLSPRYAWLIKPKYIEKTRLFYENYGGLTLILARFLPIIRTFAPFIAGISQMSAVKFTFYNLISAFLWTFLLLGAGYFLGQFSFIKENFNLVIYFIILLSVLPALFTFLFHKIRS